MVRKILRRLQGNWYTNQLKNELRVPFPISWKLDKLRKLSSHTSKLGSLDDTGLMLETTKMCLSVAIHQLVIYFAHVGWFFLQVQCILTPSNKNRYKDLVHKCIRLRKIKKYKSSYTFICEDQPKSISSIIGFLPPRMNQLHLDAQSCL